MARTHVPGKITDPAQMMAMLDQGSSVSKVADFFGCSHAAVLQMKRRLTRQIEAAPDLVKRSTLHKGNVDSIQQLAEINKVVMEELERSRRLIIREDKAVMEREALEDQVKKDPSNTELANKLKEMAGISFANILKIQASVIDVSAEVRKQLELQLKIAETLYSAQMIAQFQEEILDAIGRVSPDVREVIIKELKGLRTLRGLVQQKK